jgi:hypothetical protein
MKDYVLIHELRNIIFEHMRSLKTPISSELIVKYICNSQTLLPVHGPCTVRAFLHDVVVHLNLKAAGRMRRVFKGSKAHIISACDT